MTALLMGWGLSKLGARLIVYVGLPLLALAAFYFALDAYGDSRYKAGVTDTDVAWKAASVKLEKQSEHSAATADKAADQRTANFAAKLASEKEKIDATVSNGGDPIDVLFPPAGVSH
jgi:hypothetical protein